MGVGMKDRTAALAIFTVAVSLVFVGVVGAGTYILDDFEDNDLDPKQSEWSTWDGDAELTNDALAGDHSLRLDVNAGGLDNQTKSTRPTNESWSRVSAILNFTNASGGGGAYMSGMCVGTNKQDDYGIAFEHGGGVISGVTGGCSESGGADGPDLGDYSSGYIYNFTFVENGSNDKIIARNVSDGGTLIGEGDVSFQTTGLGRVKFKVQSYDTAHVLTVDDVEVVDSTSLTSSTISLSNPDPTGSLTSPPSELSIDLQDSQFPSDEVQLTWTLDGTQIDQFNVTSNGTYTTQLSATQGASPGQHTWNVSATDNSGQTAQSDNTYTLPQNITIRDEAEPHPVITDTVELSAFEDEDTTPFLQNQTVTNGKIDLSQFPTNSDITIVMDSGQWENRSVQLESIYAQQNVFLINESALTVDNRFLVQDRTGNFDPVETEVILEHAINKSLWSGSGNQFRWRVVSGDNLGADESYYDNLTFDERYRIKVRNNEGDTRILGEYMAEESGVVTLTIGDIVNDPDENAATVGYEVNRTNITGEPVQINVEYNDSSDLTEDIYLEIHEQGNTSNVLVSNTTFSAGPYGEFTFVQDVPSAENGTVWVVDLDTKRTNATNVQFQDVVGPGVSGTVLDDLPGWVVAIIWVGLIFGLAGVFSQANGGLGAVVMAGVGAMVWIVGLAPPVVGGGVILLSMIVAAIVFANDRRDGGL